MFRALLFLLLAGIGVAAGAMHASQHHENGVTVKVTLGRQKSLRNWTARRRRPRSSR